MFTAAMQNGSYRPFLDLNVPTGVSAISLATHDILSVGSEDGCVRFYHLPSINVTKAIRQLGHEVASISWKYALADGNGSSGNSNVWVSSGRKAIQFSLDTEKMILTPEDAVCALELGQDEEDVLNELSINDGRNTLAFCTDAGTVGVVSLITHEVFRMKTPHSSICGSVKFVPSRPSELVSGGYDSAVLHFDFTQRTLLSRYDITAPPPASGISLSPPFVLSIAISPSGLIAIGTADGRIWFGSGGDKAVPGMSSSGHKKKRTRKWEGLRESNGSWIQVAEGPVVSVVFADTCTLIACTLLGKIKQLSLLYDGENEHVTAETTWEGECKLVAKVNATAVSDRWLVVGGVGHDGKGVVEVWATDRGEV